MRKRIFITGLLFLVMVAYANMPGNHFTNWDDEHLIVRNKAIRAVAPVFVLGNFHLTYPPFTVFSHCFDYFFWRLNPVGYHVTDLLLYALIVVTFFLLCERIIGNQEAAFLAAAIFAVHPLHVESVTWLSSRKDGLCTLFYLLAFLSYIRSRQERGRLALWLSVLFYFGAIWSKPLMVTLPLALILYDALLAPRRLPFGKIILNKLPYAIPVVLTAFAAAFLDPHNEISLSYHGGSACRTFLMMLPVLADYLRMLLLPLNLSSLYVVTIPGGFLEPLCLFSFFVLIVVLFGAAIAARKRPIFSFCVFWALVSLFPVMQIIPMNVVKADRYLYLPTAALCLLCGALISSSLSRPRRRWIVLPSLALVTAFTILTIARNADWRDSISLWESVIRYNPSNSDAYNNLGIAYMRKGDHSEAERLLKHALALRPDFASAHNNLANVYHLTGRYDEALEELQNALGLTDDIVYAANVYISTGMVYEAKGEYGKALEAFEMASKLKPVYLDDSLLNRRIADCKRKMGR